MVHHWAAVPWEHTWSLINEISILALQFEHLTVGKKLDDRAGAAIAVAIFFRESLQTVWTGTAA